MKANKSTTTSKPKALSAKQNKAAVEHALKLKVEKEQRELEDIKKTMDEQEKARQANRVPGGVLTILGLPEKEKSRKGKENAGSYSFQKTKEETKAEPKKEQPKAETKKEPKPSTMAEYLDKLITTGGTWEELVKAAQAEAEKKGSKTKLSRGTIQGHINYRVKKDSEWLTERKIELKDDGITVKKA